MRRCIVTYAEGAHEELLDISLPLYKEFAARHDYDIIVGEKVVARPAAWNKVPLLTDALRKYDEVVWFDCDLIITDLSEDFPPMAQASCHSLVRHFGMCGEVPNSGVWRLTRGAISLLHNILSLEVFWDHGWWEQAALMTLMGYTVPPQDSEFKYTKCRCVHPTLWHRQCQFMRVKWNSHPNYRADRPKIVHCSYWDMQQRVEVMRALVKDPTFNYPKIYPPKSREDRDYDEPQ